MPGMGRRFPRGVSGNPKGRPRRGASLVEHLRFELAQVIGEDGRQTRAAELARVLLQKGLDGDVAAIKLIFERIDGPPVTPREQVERDIHRMAERLAAESGLSAEEIIAEAERLARDDYRSPVRR